MSEGSVSLKDQAASRLPADWDHSSLLKLLAALTFSISLAVIVMAWGFELIGGYKPCPLCLQQRIPYYAAIGMSLVAMILLYMDMRKIGQVLLLLCAVAYIINAGLGIYHAGAEWKWWQGPSDCSGAGIADQVGSFLETLKNTRVIRCDEPSWRFLGLSFAGYNVLISLGMTVMILLGLRMAASRD